MQQVFSSLIGPSGPYYADLTGKTAIITGGATGIGYNIARYFCLMGCKVIMVNRKQEQGDEAIRAIKEDYKKEKGEGAGEAQIEWRGCDLGKLSTVKETFTKLANELERLDLLILSSGINTNQFRLCDDGIDGHFGVNALGHYYALNILYPLIRKTSKRSDVKPGSVRIVFESSEMHNFAPGSQDSAKRGRGLHFGSEEEITEGGKTLSPVELYGRTKLAMILYTKHLSECVIKPNGDDIYVLAVHPGTVETEMQNQWEDAYPGVAGTLLKKMVLATSRNAEQGAYSGLYAALSDDIVKNSWNGMYLQDSESLGKPSAQAEDVNLGYALWELSERMVTRIAGKDALGPWQ